MKIFTRMSPAWFPFPPVMYTGEALPDYVTPLAIGTPATDKSIIFRPTASYFQDTWHVKPSFTLTYGIGWNLEMPPYELQGKQVALVDSDGQPIQTAAFLESAKPGGPWPVPLLHAGNRLPTGTTRASETGSSTPITPIMGNSARVYRSPGTRITPMAYWAKLSATARP